MLKLSWMDADYNVLDTAGERVKASNIHNDAQSFSVEVGKRYHFNRATAQGFYLEPQIQAIFGHYQGADFTASNGLNVKINNYGSQILRVGTLFGYEIKGGENPWNVYGKLSYLKEFDGKINYRLNGSPEMSSYEGNWWEYGVGITAKLKDRHNLYADLHRSTSGRMQQQWGLNIGYRYSW